MKSQAGVKLKGIGEGAVPCCIDTDFSLFGITSISWSLGLSVQDCSAFPLALYSQGKSKEGTYRQQKTPFKVTAVSHVHSSVELKADKALLSVQSEYIKKKRK